MSHPLLTFLVQQYAMLTYLSPCHALKNCHNMFKNRNYTEGYYLCQKTAGWIQSEWKSTNVFWWVIHVFHLYHLSILKLLWGLPIDSLAYEYSFSLYWRYLSIELYGQWCHWPSIATKSLKLEALFEITVIIPKTKVLSRLVLRSIFLIYFDYLSHTDTIWSCSSFVLCRNAFFHLLSW